MPAQPRDDVVRIFLSYAREDFDAVSDLYDRLEALGLKPWMDKYDILPGERWEIKLSEAIRQSHFFLACLSAKSVEKRGYLQREFKQALDLWQEKLDNDIYLIPVRLDECQVPETLRAFQWANLYEDEAWWALLRAIHRGGQRLGLTLPQGLQDIPRRGRPTPWTSTAPPSADVPTVEAKPKPTPAQPDQRKAETAPGAMTITEPTRMELIPVPAGKFLMGDKKTPVDVAEFYIGRHPVTNSQYGAFVKATMSEAPRYWENGAIPRGKEEHPVVNVTWHDAVAFCQWLEKATGKPFRLPTEAEWEKAASWDEKARQKRIWPWGDTFDAAKCNTPEGKKGGTTPVGANSPAGDSPYGVADMAGNVWEWCSSLSRPYPYNAKDGREDLAASGNRVLRGGSWGNVHLKASALARYDDPPVARHLDFGFRVVVAASPL